MTKNTKNIFFMSALTIALAACGGQKEKEQADTAKTAAPSTNAAAKVHKVIVEPAYPPFVQRNPKGGLQGFDIDILQAAADKMGFQVEFMPHPWEGSFDTLNSGGGDIVAGGLTISEERKPKMDFSDGYNEIATVLLTKKDSGIQTFEQAKGKRITYQIDTSAETALKKLQGTNTLDSSLGSHSSWETVKRVMAGDVDATIGDSTILEYYAKQYPDMNFQIIYNTTLPKETNSFVVRKGDTALQDKINKGLAAIKADGTYDKIKEKWIGKIAH